MKNDCRSILFIGTWLVFLAGCLTIGDAAGAPSKIPVDLYVMSLCPYGVQAENSIIPAVLSSTSQKSQIKTNK